MYTEEQMVKAIKMTANLIVAKSGDDYLSHYQELVRDRTTFPTPLASFIKATADTNRKLL